MQLQEPTGTEVILFPTPLNVTKIGNVQSLFATGRTESVIHFGTVLNVGLLMECALLNKYLSAPSERFSRQRQFNSE